MEQLQRLYEVMETLRERCEWDRAQTHQSLLPYLVEETAEVVEAVETGTDDDLREELGDVLLQVYFHARIAENDGRFTLADVAQGVADKLERRHPHIFAGTDVPADAYAQWEQIKKAEKQRRSALDGVPEPLNALARAQKVVYRASSHGVPVDLPDAPVTAEEVGTGILNLVSRAEASGIDAATALRATLRDLETRIRDAESV